MTLPAHEEWFSTSVRRNRKSFIGAFALLFMALSSAFIGSAAFESGAASVVILLVVGLPSGLAGYLLSAQRIRDMDVSGWYALAWFPICWLPAPLSLIVASAFLAFHVCIPGSKGKNRFGADPLEN